KLFLPPGTSALTRERLVHLYSGAAKWQLSEYDERHDSIADIDFSDRGNIATHLVRCPNETAALERFEDSVHHILGLLPEAEVALLSPAEFAFRWRGLEFARARVTHEASSFKSGQEIVFGVGAEERALDTTNTSAFLSLVGRLRTTRSPHGSRHQPLWRLHPERRLESLVVRDVSLIDERLDHGCLYSPVPAFSAPDRAIPHPPTPTRDHPLAVVVLKPHDGSHLPLQGLDCWSRVEWPHARGGFQQSGYLSSAQLSSARPLLFLGAPTLHIHPAADTVLRSSSPEIDWT